MGGERGAWVASPAVEDYLSSGRLDETHHAGFPSQVTKRLTMYARLFNREFAINPAERTG
jgi:hypothetical protein